MMVVTSARYLMLVVSMMHTCSAQQSELDEKSSVYPIFVSEDNALKRAGRAIFLATYQAQYSINNDSGQARWYSAIVLDGPNSLGCSSTWLNDNKSSLQIEGQDSFPFCRQPRTHNNIALTTNHRGLEVDETPPSCIPSNSWSVPGAKCWPRLIQQDSLGHNSSGCDYEEVYGMTTLHLYKSTSIIFQFFIICALTTIIHSSL
jgi:hypothetical protein